MVRSSSWRCVDWRSLAARWAWPALFALAAGLRLYRLGAAEFWYDEAFTARLAQLPLDRLIAATAADVHPPLYYLLIWAWTKVAGNSEVAVRLPSVIASLWSLHLARRLAEAIGLSRGVTFAGALLMAVAPFQLHYAQEARQYSLLLALVLAAMLGALRRRWGWMAIASAAAMWAHNYGLLYLASVNLLAAYGLVRDRGRLVWRDLFPIVLADAVALLLYLPWAIVLRSQMTQIAANGWWVQPIRPGDLLHSLYIWLWAWSMPDWAQSHAALLAFLLVGLAVIRLSRVRVAPLLLLLALMGLTPLMAFTVSMLWRPIYLFRALIVSSVPLYCLLAWAITHSLTWPRRAWAGALVLPFLILGVVSYYGQVVADKGGMRPVVTYLRQHWEPGDVVIHAGIGSGVIFQVYGADLPQWSLPPAGYTIGGYSEATMQALGLTIAGLERTPRPWSRAWLIVTEGPTSPPAEFDRTTEVIARYGGVNVWLWRNDAMTRAGLWLISKRQ